MQFDVLLRICHALNLSEDEKKDLVDTYVKEAEAALVLQLTPRLDEVCVIFHEGKDRIGRPSCLDAFSPLTQYSPSLSEDSYKNWLRIIFPFKRPTKVKIVIAGRNRRGDNAPFFAGDEDTGIDVIQKILGIVRVKSEVHRWSKANELPNPHQSPLILLGGPGNNPLTISINDRFTSEPWIRGFFFENGDPPDEYGWIIRHRIHKGIYIKMADVATMEDRKDNQEPPYRDLEDGDAQDFGVFFVGLHPDDPQHWTVLAAGLRAMGTFAAAAAFKDPYIVKLIGERLGSDGNNYVSGMVRYRFKNNAVDRYNGCISSVFLTRGIMPKS